MIKTLDKAIALMKHAGFLENQILLASELRERLNDRELVISVIGQFKRGKSSLINALLGYDLLPVGIIPLTTVITEIRYGSSFKAAVRFADGSESVINKDELSDYISEQKNPNNQKRVEAVKLWTEHNPFESNVTLVDTPGVGSIHQHNTQTSYSYVEKSDAVLFLLSVDSPVSESEREFLLKARENASKFYFAVNKTDTITEDNLKEFLSYCKSVLSEVIGSDVSLYSLSAKTGEGIHSFLAKLINDLQSSHDNLLEESVLKKLDNILVQSISRIALYTKAEAIPLNELKMKLKQIKEKQTEIMVFYDDVKVLAKLQAEKLVNKICAYLDARIGEIKLSAENETRNLYEQLKALPSRQFEQKLLAGLESIIHDKVEELNAEGLKMLDEGYAVIVGELNEKAESATLFVSNMIKDQFGLDYPVSLKEFSVSERNDFYIRVSQNSKFLIDTDAFIHILPRTTANKKIYVRALKKMFDDLERNKNNIAYNCGYKMQESLRTMCSDFADDIIRIRDDLNELLAHVLREHKGKSEKVQKEEDKLIQLVRQLHELNST